MYGILCVQMSDDSYESASESYEPDWEDLAYQLYKEREFEQWVSWIRESKNECYASTKPDRQLRNMNKERNALVRELWHEYQFDVDTDSFDRTRRVSPLVPASRSSRHSRECIFH